MRNGAFEDIRCDGAECDKRLEVSLDWDESSQSLADDDESVDDKVRYAGWIVKDDHHYCSSDCA